MTHIPTSAIADQAREHLDEAGPINSCMKGGLELWTRELYLPGLDTDSVSEGRKRAKAGYHGWSYHEGTAGLKRGHFGDWDPDVLGRTREDPNPAHVCVVDEVAGDRWRGIGSGTPSGKVARQPASGGYNPLSVLIGYFVAPTETDAAKPTSAPAPAKSSGGSTYTVKRGDYLLAIARKHDTTVKAILRANPARRDRRSADFHIAGANVIQAGQKIHLP